MQRGGEERHNLRPIIFAIVTVTIGFFVINFFVDRTLTNLLAEIPSEPTEVQAALTPWLAVKKDPEQLLTIGHRLALKHESELALPILMRAQVLKPSSRDTQLVLAWVLLDSLESDVAFNTQMKLERLQLAKDALKVARKIDPTDPYVTELSQTLELFEQS